MTPTTNPEMSVSLCRWDQQWKQFRYLNDLNRNYITPAICLGVLQQCLHLLKFFPRPFRQVLQLQPKTDEIGHESNKDKPVETPVSGTAPQNHPCTKQQYLSKKN